MLSVTAVIVAGLLVVSAGSVFLAWVLCQPSANAQRLAARDRVLQALGGPRTIPPDQDPERAA